MAFNHYQENYDEIMRLIDSMNSKVTIDPSLLPSLTRAIEDLTLDIQNGFASASDARQLFALHVEITFISQRVRDKHMYDANLGALRMAVAQYDAAVSAAFNGHRYRDPRRIFLRDVDQMDGIVASIQPDGTAESLEYAAMYIDLASTRIRHVQQRFRLLSRQEDQALEDDMIRIMSRMEEIVNAIDANTGRVSDVLMDQIVNSIGIVKTASRLFRGRGTARNVEFTVTCAAVLLVLNRMFTDRRGSKRAVASSSSNGASPIGGAMASVVASHFTTDAIEPIIATVPNSPNDEAQND